MSTKINVRSPFYLHLIEPSPPLPDFDCTVAGLGGFAVDSQGIITLPTANVGVIDSISSDDGDFANNKFATETTATSRTIKVSLIIPPALYTNSDSVYFECPVTATQPALITSQPAPSDPPVTCSGGPTNSGSIPSQSIAVGGAAVSIDLAGFFANETTYLVSNLNQTIVTTALSGSTLTLSPNVTAGSTTVYAIARDGSYPTSCETTQSISVTITDTTQAFTCSYPSNPALQGGEISQAGAITKPSSIGSVGTIRATSSGPAITSVAANNTASAIPHTLFFDITVPGGFSNSGIVECSASFSQPGTTPKAFTCDIASLTGQAIARNGAIFLGTAAQGTVKSFTPPNPTFLDVDTDTPRTVVYQVEIPSGFANAGTNHNCTVSLMQPATVSICGSNTFHITSGKSSPSAFCDRKFDTKTAITSTAASVNALLDSQTCLGGNAFNGGGLYYGVTKQSANNSVGAGINSFYIINIDSSGIVRELEIWGISSCTGGSGSIV